MTAPGEHRRGVSAHPSHGRPVVAVVGATATGKSDLGVALARELGGEVVNADASQLYRGMDIGTAKLGPEQRLGIPHHQLDVLGVREEASVAAYQAAARADLAAIRGRGAVPVVVGGSGLYVRALLDRLDATRGRRGFGRRRPARGDEPDEGAAPPSSSSDDADDADPDGPAHAAYPPFTRKS